MRFFPLISLLLLALACAKVEREQPAEIVIGEKRSEQPVAEPEADITEPDRDAPGGTLLRLKLEKGEKWSRKLTGKVNVEGVIGEKQPPAEMLQSSDISFEYTASISKVENGIATIEVKADPLRVEKEAAQGEWRGETQTSQIRMDARARVRSDMTGLISGVVGIGIIPFPEKAIAPGSTWSKTSYRSMPPFGEVKIEESYIYRGIVNERGVRLHKVAVEGTGSVPGMKSNGTYYYSVENGSLYIAELYQTAVVPVPDKQGQPTNAVARINMQVHVEPK